MTAIRTTEVSRARVRTANEPLDALIRRLQDGDQTALEPFIERTRDTALRLAWSFLRDPHRCEDVLQDVYLTVYRKIRQLRDPDAFTTWFCRIVANRCKRVLRERRPDSLDQIAEAGAEPAWTGMAERSADRVELGRALKTLGSADRQVLTLREVLQLSYEEIAARLAVPIGTVRSRLNKARRRLADAFAPRHEPRSGAAASRDVQKGGEGAAEPSRRSHLGLRGALEEGDPR